MAYSTYFGTSVPLQSYKPKVSVDPTAPTAPKVAVDTTPATTPTMESRPTTQPKVAVENQNMTGGATNPTQVAPSFDTNLRSTVFSGAPSAQTQTYNNMTQGVAGRMLNYQYPDFHAIGPADYSQARSYLGQAAGQLGGMNIGQYGDIPVNDFARSYGLLGNASDIFSQAFAPGQDTAETRQMLLDALRGAQGPDRAGLAAQTFDLLVRQSDPQYQQDLRAVGQKNAALGRLGSGMVTNQLMDVTAQRQRDLAQAREDLALQAAQQTLADKLNVLGATGSVYGQMGAEDRANAGLNYQRASGLGAVAGQLAGLDTERFGERSANRDFQFNRDALAAQLAGQRAGLLAGLGQTEGGFATNEFGQRQSERNAGLQYGLDKFAQQNSYLNTLGGLQQQYFGQDMARAGLGQQERAYQAQQAQQAIDNAVRERELEMAGQNQAYNQWLQGQQFNANMGYGYDPSSAYFGAAGQYDANANANAQAAGQSFADYGYGNQPGAYVDPYTGATVRYR